ncbi:hypothetical protein [Arthrobacter sp. 18067]|uniref:hypothetical protein n=1 Tax=Arthrobacter sp. 18067 TaxID=2681413 RepID=UPI00135BE18D|nr:hypothetical protein [Arthrobacter sp. 18067]
MTTPETPATLIELAAAGAAYREAKEKLKSLRSQRATLVAQGFKNKLPATELAGHAGLSRQRLYLVRDLGLNALKNSEVQLNLPPQKLLESLMNVASKLPAALRETDTALREVERILVQVAGSGTTPVKDLARLAGITPEQTRKIRINAGIAPRRYAPSA